MRPDRTLLILVALLAGCGQSLPRYRGAVTDHFDGTRFHDPVRHSRGLGDFLTWQLTRDAGPWRDRVDAEPGPPPPRRVGFGDLRVTFVGHSTVLVQVDGLNVLTDPVWSERVGPASWLGPERHRPPGIRFEDLPPIDLVLVSHAHYDHLDLPTLRRLVAEHEPRILVGLGNAAFLRREGVPGAEELDWWDAIRVGRGVRARCVPARHFSNRWIFDGGATLWCGFVLESDAGSVYFAGDTGWGDHFEEIGRRCGPIRLALLPIGAYRPRWFMRPFHVDPEEAVRAHETLGAATSVAIHFGTFAQGDDGQTEPVDDLEAALARRERTGRPRFWALREGEGREVPPLDRSTLRRWRRARAAWCPVPPR